MDDVQYQPTRKQFALCLDDHYALGRYDGHNWLQHETRHVLARTLGWLRAKGWTRGDYARDASGNPVEFTAKSAVSFSVVGALGKVAGNADRIDAAKLVLLRAAPEARDVEIHNDSLASFADVEGWLERAIWMAENDDGATFAHRSIRCDQ